MSKNSKFKSTRAFTLIEIIVSLAIFSVVAVIAVGALVRVTSANRQAQAIQSGVNNMSFTLDSISREMRVGTTFQCTKGTNLDSSWRYVGGGLTGASCLLSDNSSDTVIAFTSSNVDPSDPEGCNLVYAYLFHTPDTENSTTTISKAEEQSCSNSQLQGINNNGGSAEFYPVLSKSVNITDYHIGVSGGAGEHPYAWAFIRVKGYVGTKIKDQSVFDVQTSISERTSE